MSENLVLKGFQNNCSLQGGVNNIWLSSCPDVVGLQIPEDIDSLAGAER